MRFRLAMLDVDGTLRDEGGWKPGALALLDAIAATGVPLALCSGRPLESLLGLAAERAEVSHLAAGSDALVQKRVGESWTTVGTRFLDPALVAEVEQRAEALGMELWAYTLDSWIVTELSYRVTRDMGFTNATPVLVERLTVRDDVIKLLAFARTPEQNSLLVELDGRADLAVVESYPGYNDICLATSAATKGGDLLLADLGLGWSDVLAVGDGQNDLGMLSKAGTALLMEPLRAEMLHQAVPGQVRVECPTLADALRQVRAAT